MRGGGAQNLHPAPTAPLPAAPLSRAQLVVHEATVVQGGRAEAVAKAHSTPAMAGEFARDVGAQRLLLTHFSPTFALKDSYCSVHRLGEERVAPLLRAAAAAASSRRGGGGGGGGGDARWLEEQAATLGAAEAGVVAAAGPPAAPPLPPPPPPQDAGLGARDFLERLSGFCPQPRLLAAGVLETRRYAGDGGAAPRAGALAPVTTTVDANMRELLRWRAAQGPLAVRRLWAFSHPEVRDHAAPAAVAKAAQDAFGAEAVLCARDFLAVIVASKSREDVPGGAPPAADEAAARWPPPPPQPRDTRAASPARRAQPRAG